MGKDQSKMASPPTVIKNSSRALELAMSPKQLNAVQEVILREYPFLESVYESMLLTDCSLPDCPIVFANDFFEKMTLYPKEEIIGRNCRFLQGPHTNPNTVKTIRAAVDNGQPLDVELLNYRKDGVPFMNCFLMLPIHKNANPKNRVTHFLAIQKDVTLLRPWEQNPTDWSPSEVSMWLDKWGLIQAARVLLQANVTGAQLLRMTDESLIQHGIVKSRIRSRILEKIAHIKLDPSLAYAGKLVSDSSYKTPTAGPTGTDTLKAREWWKTSPGSSSPKKSSNKENNIFPEDDDDVCDLESANAHVDDEWSDNSDTISESSSTSSGMFMTDEEKLRRLGNGENVAIKVFFGSTIVMELVPLSMPFKKVKNLIEQKLRSRCRLSFSGGDGEFSSLTSESDWRAAIQFTEDQVVRVIAKAKPVNISKLDCSMFDNLGSAVIVANSQSEIIFFNSVTRRLLGDISSKKDVPSLFPSLDVSTYIPASWSTVEAVHRDGHSISVLLTMTESKNFLQYFVVVPSLTIAPVF